MVGWDGLDMEEFENEFFHKDNRDNADNAINNNQNNLENKYDDEDPDLEIFVDIFDTIGGMGKSHLEIIYAYATMIHNLPNYELKKNMVKLFVSKLRAK